MSYPPGFNPDPIGFTPDDGSKPFDEVTGVSFEGTKPKPEEGTISKFLTVHPNIAKYGKKLLNVYSGTPLEGKVSTGMEGSLIPELEHRPDEGWGGYLARGAFNNLISPLGSPVGMIGAAQPNKSGAFNRADLEKRLAGILEQPIEQPITNPMRLLNPAPIRGELGPATSLPSSWGLPENPLAFKGGPSVPYGGTVEQMDNPAIEALLSDRLTVRPQILRNKKGHFKPNFNMGSEATFPAELPTAEPKPFKSTYPPKPPVVQDITPTQGFNIVNELNQMAQGEMSYNPTNLKSWFEKATEAKQAIKSSTLIPPTEKSGMVREIVKQAGNTFKTMMASVDLSFPLHQGRGAITQPEFWKNLPDMIKMYGSEGFYNRVMDGIIEHPNYELFKDKLAFTGEKFLKQEEAFLGNWLEHIKIPGLPETKLDPLQLYAAQVRGSDRAYAGMATKLRFDLANKFFERVQRLNPQLNQDEVADKVSKFVNTVTGRGSLGRAEKYADDLNTVFFSPRFQVSRLTMLLDPRFYLSQPKGLRLEALRAASGIASTWLGELALLTAAGGKYVTDSSNSDFGKSIIGNTRIDPGAGFDQPIVLFARLAQNKYTSPGGPGRVGKSFNIGGKEFGAPKSAYDLLWSSDPRRRGFIENKLSPLFSMFNDLIKRKLPDGSDVTVPKEIVDRVFPMFVSDMYDLYQEDPALFGDMPQAKKLGIGALGLFGDPVTTFK